jgi:hypothetical protein
MPRRREVGRHSSLPPVPQLEPTTKPASVTAVIRRLVILDQTANAKALEARLTEAGFPGTKLSTITTIRADALATLREAAALGLLRTRRSRFLSRPMPGLAGRGRRVGRLRSRKPPPSDPPRTQQKPPSACQPAEVLLSVCLYREEGKAGLMDRGKGRS